MRNFGNGPVRHKGCSGQRRLMADENGVRRGTVSAAERAFAALVGYTAGAAVVLPFDRVKSLLQVSALSRRQGAVGVAKQLFQAHGMGGLYQGGTAHMLIAPYTVFYYSLYDEILAHGRRATSETHGVSGHPLTPLFAALVARSVETVARQPLELVRTLMQSSNTSITISESWHALRGQPLHCWFRGMTPTLLRDVPFSGTYWLFYETAKQRVRIPEEAVRSATARALLQSLLCGAGAGMAATVLIAPLDVIKTMRQHRLHTGEASSYGAILHTIRDSPAVAFAGIGPRLVRIPAGLATMMAGLEVTKLAFEQRHTAHRQITE